MLLIKNARMIDPASGTDAKKDVLVQGEKIRKIRDTIREDEAAVFPGTKRTCFR